MSDWDNDEPLGYKSPPKWTRFKKGQSGNPRGRPKKTKKPESSSGSKASAILRREIDREVTITEAGQSKQITIQEAITKAQVTQAVKGSPLAQRDVINRIDELEKSEASEKERNAEAERDAEAQKLKREERLYRYWASVKNSQAKAWAQAKKAGKTEPDFPWPHPDDVLLDEGRKKYRLRGPMSGEGVVLFKFIRAERDLALARMVREISPLDGRPKTWANIWGYLVRSHDLQLPLRWQIGLDWASAATHLFEMTPKALQREIDRLSSSSEIRRKAADARQCGEGYKVANENMWPALDLLGYRSLAQFEKAYEETGGKPPCPREPARPAQIG